MKVLKVRKTRLAAAVAGISLAGAIAVSAVQAAQGATQAETSLPGSAPAFTAHAAVTGLVAGSRQLTIQVWLTPDLSGLASFATGASTPGTPQFRHYLSPPEYTARFGPAASQVNAVESWLRGQGFSAISADAQRTYVRATAPVSAIDAAFRVQEKLYRSTATENAGPYQLQANDVPVTLPSSLAGGVLAVTGLDNQAPSLPLERPGAGSSPARITADGVIPAGASSTAGGSAKAAANCSAYFGQLQKSGLPSLFGATTLPVEACGYDAAQLQSAYGITGNDGAGQTIAFAQYGNVQDMFATLQDYAKANHMPAPSPSLYAQETVDGTGASCGGQNFWYGEEQLDVEAVHVIAPAAKELVVGGNVCNSGDFGSQGTFDAENAILNGRGGKPLASIVSNSWADNGEASQDASLTNAIMMRAAAEGVGMYFAAGDQAGVQTPATDPWVTAVGGTTLAIGKTGSRLFETGWSDAFWTLTGKTWEPQGIGSATGGGASALWAEPGYQRGVVPSALTVSAGDKGGAGRAAPDISADADPMTPFAEGELPLTGKSVYSESPVGGTSLATPLIAGLVADAQQGQAVPFGFLNPALYRLAGTSAIRDILPVTSKTPTQYRGTYCNPAYATCESEPAVVEFDAQGPSIGNPGLDNYTGQVTLKGYDTMTGIGTPNGTAFDAALRKLG